MTPATTFAGRRVALFGLGGSGLATALALQAGGADVLASDDSPASLDKAGAQGIATGDLRDADWSGFAALVLAPGVPLTHPEPHWTVRLAEAAGVEIIGDIELFCRERAKIAPGSPFVAITGTNGKSTTTALVAHVLGQAGRDVQMGGNIGTAILSLAPPSGDRVHVIEMSSFQIDLTPSFNAAPAFQGRHAEEDRGAVRLEARSTAVRASRRSSDAPQHDAGRGEGRNGPSVGVLLNISPDHLDRHGAMESYAAIKARLVERADIAVIGLDDDASRRIYERLSAAGRPVRAITGGMLPGDGLHFQGSRIFETTGTSTRQVAELKGIRSLRGAHNAQNAAVAIAVAEALGVDEEVILSALSTFPGLQHRMEEVGRLGDIAFINDSKATNADSAEKALASFDHVFWIAGGTPKEGGIAPLRPYFSRIDKAYLIGAAADEFAAILRGDVAYLHCGTLDKAVALAAADAIAAAQEDSVVLLSPACASYDQYPNFEVRGDHFRDLVRALPGVEMRS